jgi:[ribosomal protein S18]-alanine N-acetyltransferase
MQIVPMTAAYAADIVSWRYPAPYDCYDMTDAGLPPEVLRRWHRR